MSQYLSSQYTSNSVFIMGNTTSLTIASVPSPRLLRSREPPPIAPRTKTGGAEFQGFKLRQTQRDKGEMAGKKEDKHDFGVKLKVR